MVLEYNEEAPEAVLLLPVVLDRNDKAPVAVLPVPEVFDDNELTPEAVFREPVEAGFKASTPNEVLVAPIRPARTLLRLKITSALLVEPMKSVVAFTVLPANAQLLPEALPPMPTQLVVGLSQ